MIVGKLHSIETMGLVDGPGIRTIFFLQGCPLRCSYCHNPDTQSRQSKTLIRPDQVLQVAQKYRSYYRSSGGGITLSGGEPLLQGEFVMHTFELLKAHGFHTTLDTSGYGESIYFPRILAATDLILLDIKQTEEESYQTLTGCSKKGLDVFMSHLKNAYAGKVWIRHVMVPGFTDNSSAVEKLFQLITPFCDIIERIEILPYHKLGEEKYRSLGKVPPFADVPEMDPQTAEYYQTHLMDLLANKKNDSTKAGDYYQKEHSSTTIYQEYSR